MNDGWQSPNEADNDFDHQGVFHWQLQDAIVATVATPVAPWVYIFVESPETTVSDQPRYAREANPMGQTPLLVLGVTEVHDPELPTDNSRIPTTPQHGLIVIAVDHRQHHEPKAYNQMNQPVALHRSEFEFLPCKLNVN